MYAFHYTILPTLKGGLGSERQTLLNYSLFQGLLSLTHTHTLPPIVCLSTPNPPFIGGRIMEWILLSVLAFLSCRGRGEREEGGGRGEGGGWREGGGRMGAEREAQSVAECRMQGWEMLPTRAIGWRASVLRGKEVGRFRKVVGTSIVGAGSPRSR